MCFSRLLLFKNNSTLCMLLHALSNFAFCSYAPIFLINFHTQNNNRILRERHCNTDCVALLVRNIISAIGFPFVYALLMHSLSYSSSMLCNLISYLCFFCIIFLFFSFMPLFFFAMSAFYLS